MIKSVIITLALTCSAFGQQVYNYVATTGNVSLSGAGTAATIQQPSTGQLPVLFPKGPSVGAAIYCSVACTATVAVGNTSAGAASATAGTVNPVLPNSPKPLVTFYTASNSSGETTLVTYNLAAGQTMTLDLGSITLGGASDRVTITIGSITGTANITFFPQEIH